jgi:hypothetical protein
MMVQRTLIMAEWGLQSLHWTPLSIIYLSVNVTLAI